MTRKLLAVLLATCATLAARADTWTDPETGYTWTYQVNDDDGATICGPFDEDSGSFAPCILPRPE